MSEAFDDVRLDDSVEQGAVGGPLFSTTVIVLASGKERRNRNWSSAKISWDIGYGVDSNTAYQDVLAFFYARQGRYRGFRFKDWSDYSAIGQTCSGTADGTNTTFQLLKNYMSGSETFSRIITRTVDGTLNVYDNGTLLTEGTDYTETLGVLTFATAPTSGHTITADFEFDVPVRVDTDQLSINVAWEGAWSFQSIPIVGVPE